MIRFKDRIFEDFFINPDTAVITDKNGNIEDTRIIRGRLCWHCIPIHRIQAHTAWGFKKGLHIHHIDENVFNNALSNLQYLTPTQHHSLHKHDEIDREKMREARKGKTPAKGMIHSSEWKEQHKRYMTGRTFWNNGIEQKFTKDCPGEGWNKGMLKK